MPYSTKGTIIELDLDDITVCVTVRVKGLHPPHMVWHHDVPRRSLPADRVPGVRPRYIAPRRVEVSMDIKADQKVAFRITPVDEANNPTVFDGTIVYTVDDASILTLVDNGDGSGEVTAVGVLGTSILTATITPAVGAPVVRSEAINVVAGDAQGFTLVFDEPVEATPDV